jgi:hypothetical protein
MYGFCRCRIIFEFKIPQMERHFPMGFGRRRALQRLSPPPDPPTALLAYRGVVHAAWPHCQRVYFHLFFLKKKRSTRNNTGARRRSPSAPEPQRSSTDTTGLLNPLPLSPHRIAPQSAPQFSKKQRIPPQTTRVRKGKQESILSRPPLSRRSIVRLVQVSVSLVSSFIQLPGRIRPWLCSCWFASPLISLLEPILSRRERHRGVSVGRGDGGGPAHPAGARLEQRRLRQRRRLILRVARPFPGARERPRGRGGQGEPPARARR